MENSVIFLIIIVTITFILFYRSNVKKKTLVYFYMDNCPHCIKFDKIWNTICNKNVTYAEVSPQISWRFDVHRFPTIRLYDEFGVDKKYIEYHGPRDKQSINNFINSH